MQERRPIPVGKRQSNGIRRAAKSPEVLMPHEDFIAVRADGLIHAVSIEKSVVKDGDEGFFVSHEPVIQVNPHRQACRTELKNASAL
jgi:hypothetical protein